jgi:hypothetical protein
MSQKQIEQKNTKGKYWQRMGKVYDSKQTYTDIERRSVKNKQNKRKHKRRRLAKRRKEKSVRRLASENKLVHPTDNKSQREERQ